MCTRGSNCCFVCAGFKHGIASSKGSPYSMAPSSTSTQAPTRRHSKKSAPRGVSPNPKALKKAAQASKQEKPKRQVKDVYATPPTRATEASLNSGEKAEKKSKNKDVKRSITFSGVDQVTPIEASNPAPKAKKMDMKKADQILMALQDGLENLFRGSL